MDELAQVITAEIPHVHLMVSDGYYVAAGERLANAVRTYLESPEVVERVALVFEQAIERHGGNPEGTLDDARAALNAAGGKGVGR